MKERLRRTAPIRANQSSGENGRYSADAGERLPGFLCCNINARILLGR